MFIRAVFIALLTSGLMAHAQTYPNRAVRIVVPFATGGGGDIVARMIGQKLTESWGQQMLIDNRAGAGGNIGAEIVARAAPDGYTLMITGAALAINPTVYRNVPYDVVKDFSPITRPVLYPNILVVHPSLPVRTVKDLVALAKSRPNELAYASGGAGTGTHVAAEMFKLQARVKIVHIPYKGAGAMMGDLLGGQVALTFSSLPTLMPFVTSGKLRALAITTEKRWPGLPLVPTLSESGFPGFEISTWIGMLAPAGTPKNIIDKVHGEVARFVFLPDVRARFYDLGIEPVGDSPEQFTQYIKSELSKYAKVVKEAGIHVE